jgi:hypothetical protein
MGMDCLRGAKLLRMDRIRNNEIRRVGSEETIIERVEKKRLKLYGRVMRMEGDR